jgi:predicted alpha/beta-fold hydrolase
LAGDISVPFLVLQALDDPVFADRVRDIVPLEQLTANPHVVYMETAEGGHFGFVEGIYSVVVGLSVCRD